MAVNIHITIIELNALHTKRQNLFQELDAVIHVLMEAKHWGLRKSRNSTSLNSRFKSLDTRHNLSSSKGPKPLQLKLLTTYIPKTSAFTLAFSTSQRLRTTRASARTFFTFRHYITPSARNF